MLQVLIVFLQHYLKGSYQKTKCKAPFRPRRISSNIRPSSFYCLLSCYVFLLIALTQLPLVDATLITSANIEQCTNDGVSPLKCKKKLVVTLAVDPNQKEGSEEVDFIKHAMDQTQEDSKWVSFSPIKVTMSRSEVRHLYPLVYIKPFNAKPYEEVISGNFVSRCNDHFDESATCGLAKSGGKPIPHSQGFCCSCDVCQALGMCPDNARSQRSCQLFGKYTSASCLRHSKDWYDGYNIGPYMVDYSTKFMLERQIESSIPDAGSLPKTQKAILSLSPENMMAISEDFGATAKIVGILSSHTQPLDLTRHILFTPLMGVGGDRVSRESDEWMILDESLVTLDGRNCDKVGVSYEAFATQPDACRRAVGSCLSSQLDDYRKMDMKAIASGEDIKYMLKSYGNFSMVSHHNATTSKNINYLSCVVLFSSPVLITLTLPADDLHFIVSVAPGTIVDASISRDTVTVNSKGTDIVAKVKNTGKVTSRFRVLVVCSENVLPILEKNVFLNPSEVQKLRFDLYVEGVSRTGMSFCNVRLENVEGHVLDQKKIEFKTEEIKKDGLIPDINTGVGQTGVPPASEQGESSFGFLKGLSKLWDFVSNKITHNIGEVVGILLLSLFLIYVLFMLCQCACDIFRRRREAQYHSH